MKKVLNLKVLFVFSFPVGVYMVRHLVQFFPSSSLLGLLLVGGSKWFQRVQLVSQSDHDGSCRWGCKQQDADLNAAGFACGFFVFTRIKFSAFKLYLFTLQVSIQPLRRMEGWDHPHSCIHHRGIQLHHLPDGNRSPTIHVCKVSYSSVTITTHWILLLFSDLSIFPHILGPAAEPLLGSQGAVIFFLIFRHVFAPLHTRFK